MNGDPIQTHHVYPPISMREYDWCAYRDPESKMVGWGKTEAEALADFERLELEADCERECWQNGHEECQFALTNGGKCPLEIKEGN